MDWWLRVKGFFLGINGGVSNILASVDSCET